MIPIGKKRLYILFVSTIVLLLASSQWLIHHQLNNMKRDGELINDAGRMRMLSQRLLQQSLRTEQNNAAQSDVCTTLNTFNEHRIRVKEGIEQNFADLAAEEIDLSKELSKKLSETAAFICKNGFDSNIINELIIVTEEFLPVQNEKVASMQLYYERKIDRLSLIEITLSIVTVLVIVLEIWLIFIPIDKASTEKNQKIEKLLQRQYKLVKTVAHDLRNPIGSIKALHEILSSEIEFKNEEEKEMCNLIQISAEQALQTVTDTLSNTEIDFKELDKKDIVDINNLLETQIKIIKSIKSYQDRVILKVNDTSYDVFIDAFKFSRVIQNIISNALKFSDKEIVVNHYLKNHQLHIDIEDKGIGFEKEELEQVFVKPKGKSGLKGEKSYGMGLAIAKEIIEEHGGSINVDSKPKEGSTFSIQLPVVQTT